MQGELDVLRAGLTGAEDVEQTQGAFLILIKYAEYLRMFNVNVEVLSSSRYLTQDKVRGETSGGQ